jgi:2-polyprenyl-3-methyl-5-hydroxy-6-metoxy-1,4-benzoquinol methylase
MAKDQQTEALNYFQDHAREWSQKAKTLSQVKFNVIQARNSYALEVIKERSSTRSVLDVGCGTGDLVMEIARGGIPGIGLDFAQDMIDLAVKNAAEQAISGVEFICESVFEVELLAEFYDVIVANGFIEYISQDELVRFLKIAAAALSLGGSFVLGSRNRLFNLYSLNEYTRMELEGEDSAALLEEAVALATARSLDALTELTPARFQDPETEHTRTNIGVSTRYQYTPLQLKGMLAEVGLQVAEICPIHIHGVPPAFKNDHPEVHTSIANLLQSYGRGRLDLVPQASTFMIHARKGEA